QHLLGTRHRVAGRSREVPRLITRTRVTGARLAGAWVTGVRLAGAWVTGAGVAGTGVADVGHVVARNPGLRLAVIRGTGEDRGARDAGAGVGRPRAVVGGVRVAGITVVIHGRRLVRGTGAV